MIAELETAMTYDEVLQAMQQLQRAQVPQPKRYIVANWAVEPCDRVWPPPVTITYKMTVQR